MKYNRSAGSTFKRCLLPSRRCWPWLWKMPFSAIFEQFSGRRRLQQTEAGRATNSRVLLLYQYPKYNRL